jgi:ankyrin
MLTDDRMLVRSHFTRYRPFFKAKTHEDYGLAEIAAAAGSVNIIDMFRKSYGYDVNRLNTELDMTLIHCATQFGQGGTVRWLVEEAGADPRKGRNIVLTAAEHGRLSVYNYFLDMGINARNTAEYNELTVHLAHSGAIDCIERSIEKNGVEKMRSVNHEGRSIFSAAVRGGQYEIVMLCVRTGLGKIDQRWNQNWTHLHVAALEGQFKLIRRLVQEFPDLLNPQMVDQYNRTMLFYAGVYGDFDEFIGLVTDYYSEKVCLKLDINGISIAHAACEEGRLAFMKQFTKKFGNECLQQTDNRGLTALHYGCLSHNLELIEWLVVEHKMSLSATDSFGKTPLHYLAEKALENPSLCLWEDILSFAEKFGIEYVTDFRDSSGQSVKDYLEGAVDQSKVLAEINMLCYHRNGYN